jgi:hypothetical protein
MSQNSKTNVDKIDQPGPSQSNEAKAEAIKTATGTIIKAIELAQSRGAFKLQESSEIFNALQILTTAG